MQICTKFFKENLQNTSSKKIIFKQLFYLIFFKPLSASKLSLIKRGNDSIYGVISCAVREFHFS